MPVETGEILSPPELAVVQKHLSGLPRGKAFASVYGETSNTSIRAAQFWGKPAVQAYLAACTASGLRDGLDTREAFVADQHALIQEARAAGQYGPAMSGRATLARVLGFDQAAPIGVHRGASDQELLVQLRVALGPAVADAAARELLGDGADGADGDAS